MTDTTKFKNICVNKATYSDVMTLSKEIFEVPLSLSKTLEYVVEKEMKRLKKGKNKWQWKNRLRQCVQHVREMVILKYLMN